jgi:hypothetical protein
MNIRHQEERDYDPIIQVLDNWFDGRPQVKLLPRIFFVHFRQRALLRKNTTGSSASWPALCLRLIRVRRTSILSPSIPIIENAVSHANSTPHSSRLCYALAVPRSVALHRL